MPNVIITKSSLKMGNSTKFRLYSEIVGEENPVSVPKIEFKKNYRIKNDADEIIDDIPAKNISKNIKISSLPADIHDALSKINNYLEILAYEKEGLDLPS